MTDWRRAACAWLDRGQIIQILEDHSFQCYDSEPTADLIEALILAIDDGDIDESVLED